jgi:peptidoglycan/LPS O-acetylase OafA/YrhL
MLASQPIQRFSDFPVDHSHPNNFDLLRYLLAVLVILSHSFLLLYGNDSREPFMLLSRGQYSGGSIAVDLFLCISGFLVIHSWLRRKRLVRFLSGRVRRVYPGYAVAVIFSLSLVWALDPAGKAFLQRYATEPLLWIGVLTFTLPPIPGFLEGNPFHGYINSSLWTILYEFGCYLLVGLLGLLGLAHRRRFMAGLLVSFWVVYSLAQLSPRVFGLLYEYQLHHWVRMVTCFLAGAVGYLYRDKIPFHARWFYLSLALSAALFLGGYGFVPMLPLLGTYMVLYLAFQRRIPGQGFGKRGDLSYGLYLYAFPIQQMLVAGLGHALTPWILFVLAWGITVLCAWVSWTVVERPFLRRS